VRPAAVERLMPRFRKRPVVIEAVQWTGENGSEVAGLLGDHPLVDRSSRIMIATLEGEMRADVGDFIIRGVRGEFYPCKPDIFLQTYDEVVAA
jgi:hypothetical protein